MATPAETFLSDIDAFLARSGMSQSQFSHLAVNDRSFVSDLRKGRMPNLGLVKRVQDFIASQQESAA